MEEKIQERINLDIQPAIGPTTWVDPVVVIPKSGGDIKSQGNGSGNEVGGDIRLCIDMRRANESILRERHPTPTVDEISQSLNSKCAPQYEFNSSVTMATYRVPDLPHIKSFSGHLWHSILIIANSTSYA